ETRLAGLVLHNLEALVGVAPLVRAVHRLLLRVVHHFLCARAIPFLHVCREEGRKKEKQIHRRTPLSHSQSCHCGIHRRHRSNAARAYSHIQHEKHQKPPQQRHHR
ncbi:hypothetical protein DQ04_05721060, partial [Trypanosoma grayi]|uniref:hypothetical protein n=1 Tax=Trypanosoma grayi TaxID=71804 RepID=UPI0004F43999